MNEYPIWLPYAMSLLIGLNIAEVALMLAMTSRLRYAADTVMDVIEARWLEFERKEDTFPGYRWHLKLIVLNLNLTWRSE